MKTEEWTKDFHGMINTAVMDVRDGNVVHVTDELMDEFDIPKEHEVVQGGVNPRFVWEVPYDTMVERLRADGWEKRADPEE